MRKLWLLFCQITTITLAVMWGLKAGHFLPFSQTAIIRETVSSVSDKNPPPFSFRVAAKKVTPCVVNIYTSKQVSVPRQNALPGYPDLSPFFGPPSSPSPEVRQQNSLGSGVIVTPDGFILTNDHVIEGAQEIQVALSDGRNAQAVVIGTDPDSDLAVLHIDLDHLPAITFGSSDQVRVGDEVLAVGNPFGVGETVTSGIISALGRSRLGINTFENFIQTDAAINPGNSGGALVDVNGNLIGINSAIYSRSGGSQGIGFSIPVSIAQNVMEQIIKKGSVTRGWIGVEMQDLTPELAQSFQIKQTQGALIAGILKQGPAAQSGLAVGDIVLTANQHPVKDAHDLLVIIAGLEPNQQAIFQVMRQQRTLNIPITIGQRPQPVRSQIQEGEEGTP